MPTLAGAAFNRTFAKWGIGGMLFGPNGPEHETHLLSARVAIRFSLPHTTVTARAADVGCHDASRRRQDAPLIQLSSDAGPSGPSHESIVAATFKGTFNSQVEQRLGFI